MIKKLLLTTGLLLPLTVLALEIQPGKLFTDVRSNAPELAAINLLAREGIMQGYTSGRFNPSRLINRAEFLKVAVETAPANNVLEASMPAADGSIQSGTAWCFPDARVGEWFLPYACALKEAGIIQGKTFPRRFGDQAYLDPSEPVTYGEALKILTLAFQYDVSSAPGHWAEKYYLSAAKKKVDIPVTINLDTPLTRAQAARLSAAFLSESEGMLDTYRLAEAGVYGSSISSSHTSSHSNSSVSSSLSSPSSPSSTSSSSSSSSSSSALFTLPATSHFLLVGQKSDAIGSGIIRSENEPAKVVAAQIKLFQDVRSLHSIELVTEKGDIIATLLQRTTTDLSDYKQTFELQLQPEKYFPIPANADIRVIARAVVKTPENAGFSDELIHMRLFSVTIHGDITNTTKNIPFAPPFPKHQTAFGRIVSIARTSPATAPLISGMNTTLTSFAVQSEVIAGKAVALSQLTFAFEKMGTVGVSNIRLRKEGAGEVTCSMNEQERTIACPQLKDGIGGIAGGTPLSLSLIADVDVPSQTITPSFQVSLGSAGSPEALGSIDWTDFSGTFRWIEGASPVVVGTMLR